MNKKILVLTISVLAFVMLVTPVMAAPAERISVTLIVTRITNPPAEKRWTTNGNVTHFHGVVRTFTVVIEIPGEDDLEGDMITTRRNHWNLKTAQHIYSGDTVLTLTGGTFEGRWNGLISDFPAPADVVMHCVMHGTGAFKGQTLKFSYEGPLPRTENIEGVLIRPQG